MKQKAHKTGDKKNAFEDLRFKYFPLEDDQTIKAFKMLEPIQSAEKQFILGKEKDFKMNKRFLKTKFNRGGKDNHRSPYSTILWPDNERCYPSVKIQNFENIFNTNLKHYIDSVYQEQTLANAFMEEINNEDSKIGIALLSSDIKSSDTDESAYLYKLINEFDIKITGSMNKSIEFQNLSRNQFIFYSNYKPTQEKFLFYGNLNMFR